MKIIVTTLVLKGCLSVSQIPILCVVHMIGIYKQR